jgi:hypothetical protein
MFAGFREDYLKAAGSVDSAKICLNGIAGRGGSKYALDSLARIDQGHKNPLQFSLMQFVRFVKININE